MSIFSSTKKKIYVGSYTYNASNSSYSNLLPIYLTLGSRYGLSTQEVLDTFYLELGKGVQLNLYNKWAKKTNSYYDQLGHATASFSVINTVTYTEAVEILKSKLASNQSLNLKDIRVANFTSNNYLHYLCVSGKLSGEDSDYTITTTDLVYYDVYIEYLEAIYYREIMGNEDHPYSVSTGYNVGSVTSKRFIGTYSESELNSAVEDYNTCHLVKGGYYSGEDYIDTTYYYRYYYTIHNPIRKQITVTDANGNTVYDEILDEDFDDTWLYLEYTVNTYGDSTDSTKITETKNYYIYESQLDAISDGYGGLITTSVQTANKTIISPIPMRTYNSWHTNDNIAEWNRKAFKRFCGTDYDEQLAKIKKSISSQESDIDHVYLVFGIPLSSDKPAHMKYIYQFFKELHDTYIAKILNHPKCDSYAQWLKGGWLGNNVEQTIYYKSTQYAYDFQMTWYNSYYCIRNGLANPNATEAKIGEIYFLAYKGKLSNQVVTGSGNNASYASQYSNIGSYSYTEDDGELEIIEFRKQISKTQYETYFYSDLTYVNYIYKGKSVGTTAYYGLYSDYETCKFIVPIEIQVWQKLPLATRDTVANFCTNVVLNYYVVKKVKTGLLQKVVGLVMIVVGVILCIISWGSSSAVSSYMIAAGVAMIVGGAYLVCSAIFVALLRALGFSRSSAERIAGYIYVAAKMVAIFCSAYVQPWFGAAVATLFAIGDEARAEANGQGFSFKNVATSAAISFAIAGAGAYISTLANAAKATEAVEAAAAVETGFETAESATGAIAGATSSTGAAIGVTSSTGAVTGTAASIETVGATTQSAQAATSFGLKMPQTFNATAQLGMGASASTQFGLTIPQGFNAAAQLGGVAGLAALQSLKQIGFVINMMGQGSTLVSNIYSQEQIYKLNKQLTKITEETNNYLDEVQKVTQEVSSLNAEYEIRATLLDFKLMCARSLEYCVVLYNLLGADGIIRIPFELINSGIPDSLDLDSFINSNYNF